MKILGESLKTHKKTAYTIAAALIVGLTLVSCGGGGGYGGGGGMGVIALPPAAFSLSMPANGAASVGTMPVLSWTASLYATSYTVEVSTSNTFPLPLTISAAVAKTNYAVTAGALQASTTYFWRVIATDAYGMFTSATFSFTT